MCGAALVGLAQSEVEAALEDDDMLLTFAVCYNQSLDWRILGDPHGMVGARARWRASPAARGQMGACRYQVQR